MCYSYPIKNASRRTFRSTILYIQLLVIGETLEILIPLAYLICFVSAYYGPNAEVLGHVKNGYWQFKATDNIMGSINNLLIFVIVDGAVLILVSIFLYCGCNINVFHVYIHLMKEYGQIFSIHIAYLMAQLFCDISVACGLDFTFQFDWVLDQEKWQNITGIANMTA